MILEDKMATMQVIGSLIKSPVILTDTEKYRLTPSDFNSKFERIIFATINNLYFSDVKHLAVFDIDNYINNNEELSKVFKQNNGLQYITDAIELAQVENFNYYYIKIKKFSALRFLEREGFNIEKIYYNNPLDTKKTQESLDAFEQMSIQDIFTKYRASIDKIEYNCVTENKESFAKISDGLRDLIDELKIKPEVGANLQGIYTNTATRGARKGKFYLRSGASGTGKTRSLVGEACNLSYPLRYNTDKNLWEITGNTTKSLIIVTEQTLDEIQTLIVAYLSGVNEDAILYGRYKDNEEERVYQAVAIVDYYKDNLILEQMPNPTIDKIKLITRKNVLEYNLDNLFYDYIFTSEGLLGEYRDLKIREDVMLMMLSSTLKDLAVELNLFVMSATQLSGEWETKKGLRNQNLIRGAKSIVDKIDVGMITLPVSKEEYNIMEPFFVERGIKPTQSTDIYKNRRGKYNEIRIWSDTDLGTCRRKDLFVTTPYYEPIKDFQLVDIIMDFEGSAEATELVKKLNERGTLEDKSKNNEKEKEKQIKVDALLKEDFDWDTII